MLRSVAGRSSVSFFYQAAVGSSLQAALPGSVSLQSTPPPRSTIRYDTAVRARRARRRPMRRGLRLPRRIGRGSGGGSRDGWTSTPLSDRRGVGRAFEAIQRDDRPLLVATRNDEIGAVWSARGNAFQQVRTGSLVADIGEQAERIPRQRRQAHVVPNRVVRGGSKGTVAWEEAIPALTARSGLPGASRLPAYRDRSSPYGTALTRVSTSLVRLSPRPGQADDLTRVRHQIDIAESLSRQAADSEHRLRADLRPHRAPFLAPRARCQ
jgi:hypothetical protein